MHPLEQNRKTRIGSQAIVNRIGLQQEGYIPLIHRLPQPRKSPVAVAETHVNARDSERPNRSRGALFELAEQIPGLTFPPRDRVGVSELAGGHRISFHQLPGAFTFG